MRGFVCLLPLLLCGCIVKTAVDVVTLPVRATVGVAKAVTPNHAKEDRKRGRAERKAEKRATNDAKHGDDDGAPPNQP